MAHVLRTPQARDSLKELGRYIADQSQSRETTLRFLDLIETKCEQYARQPLMGEARPDLGEPDLGEDVRFFRSATTS